MSDSWANACPCMFTKHHKAATGNTQAVPLRTAERISMWKMSRFSFDNAVRFKYNQVRNMVFTGSRSRFSAVGGQMIETAISPDMSRQRASAELCLEKQRTFLQL